MRMVVMLVALLIIGLLIYKQISPHAAPHETKAISAANTPAVPTNPNDVKRFETQMNNYMTEQDAKRAAAIESAESQ